MRQMMVKSIKVNRAPVLTLWGAVVAERLGFDRDEALTLGRVVAGLDAYSKGKALGLFSPRPKQVRQLRKRLEQGANLRVELLGRAPRTSGRGPSVPLDRAGAEGVDARMSERTG
jgi:hypothetical protein